MEKYKKVIAIICVIVIILIAIIITIMLKKIEEQKIDEYDSTQDELGINNVNPTIQNVDIKNNFYTVKSCIDKFYAYYFESTNTENTKYIIDEEQTNSNKSFLYNMLDKEYIEFKDITQENVLEKLPKINKSDIQITQMYVSQRTPNVAVYFIYGVFNDRVNNIQSEFYNVIKIDMLNKTFKIILQDLAENKYNNIEVGNNITLEEFSEIENSNNSNIFDYEIITDEEYIKDIFNQYKQNLIYNRPLAYKQLDNEYKEKRFPTYEEFEAYVDENSRRNVLMEIEKYQKNVYDGYTQFICVDQNGKYYIFNVIHVMDYGAILDTHSVNLPQFVEKYEEANNQEKVGMNIEKIIDALNEKDYKYIYNKLDETFKSNNYTNINSFIEYIKNNFYNLNEIEYNDVSEEGELYIYNATIKNAEDENVTKNITIIMKLLENNDYIISFSID